MGNTLTFNPNHLKEIVCAGCSNNTFKQTSMIYHLPKLASPDGEEKYLPTTVWKCEKCGEVHEDIPDSLSTRLNQSSKDSNTDE